MLKQLRRFCRLMLGKSRVWRAQFLLLFTVLLQFFAVCFAVLCCFLPVPLSLSACHQSATGRPSFHAQYDWTTGCWTVDMNGGSSASYLTRTPCVPLFCALYKMVGNRRVFRLPGEGGDHVHCAVEPLPGHIRCQQLSGTQFDKIMTRSEYREVLSPPSLSLISV